MLHKDGQTDDMWSQATLCTTVHRTVKVVGSYNTANLHQLFNRPTQQEIPLSSEWLSAVTQQILGKSFNAEPSIILLSSTFIVCQILHIDFFLSTTLLAKRLAEKNISKVTHFSKVKNKTLTHQPINIMTTSQKLEFCFNGTTYVHDKNIFFP